MNKTNCKKIIVTSRGMILTSRGMCRGPIERPYYETLDAILTMISRYEAEVYEVLPDGTKVRLTMKNFDADNAKKERSTNSCTVIHDTDKDGVDVPGRQNNEPTDPTAKGLSRKERKKLEYEQRKKAESDKISNTSPLEKESQQEQDANRVVSESNTDVSDAIE